MKASTFYYLFILTTLLSLQATAQDVISDVVSSGNEQRHILQEYQGEEYIVKISSLDSLYTYRFDDESLIHLHTNHSIGAYTDYFQLHSGKWLFYDRPDGAAAYNFVKNEFEIFEYEGDISRSQWRDRDHGIITLDQASPDYSTRLNFVLDSNLNILSTSSESSGLVEVSDENYIFREYDGLDHVFSAQNRETGEFIGEKILQDGVRHVYDGNLIYYFDEASTELRRFDFITNTEEVIHVVESDLWRFNLSKLEHHIFLDISNNDQGVYYTVVINKSDQKIKILEEANLDYSNNSMKDIIIFEKSGDYDSLHLYNFETDLYSAVKANNSPANILSIADRYILFSEWFAHYIYDTETGNKTEFFIQLPLSYRLKVEEIRVGGNYYIDLGSDIEFIDDLLYFNDSEMTIEYSDAVPISRRGLIERSEITRSGNDILVLNNEHLYTIIEDSLHQLDEYEIIENSHKSHRVDPDGLLWAEKNEDSFTFYKYLNGEKKVLTSFLDENDIDLYNLQVSSFIDGDQTIFINGRSGFEYKVLLINKENNAEIQSQDTPLESLGISLFFEGHYYYTKSSLFYRLDEEGNETLLDFEAPIFGIGASVVFENKLFLTNDKNIVSIQNGEIVEEYSFEDGEGDFGYFETLNGYLTLSTDGNGFIYKDNVWQKFDVNPDYWHAEFSDIYIQAVESTGTNLRYTRLLNMETNEYVVLPEEISTMRLVSAFIHKEEQYLIAITGSLPNYTVKIFKMTEGFTEGEEVTSFEAVGWGINANYKPYGDEGLLYIGNRLFLMNDLLEFVPLSTINGDNKSVFIEEEEGTFYFIALHPEKGRQVFTTVAFSERVGTSDFEFSDISVFPNPASDLLTWKSELPANTIHSADIYNLQGQWMMKSKGQSADISLLNTGLYVVVFNSEEGNFLGSFEFMKVE